MKKICEWFKNRTAENNHKRKIEKPWLCLSVRKAKASKIEQGPRIHSGAFIGSEDAVRTSYVVSIVNEAKTGPRFRYINRANLSGELSELACPLLSSYILSTPDNATEEFPFPYEWFPFCWINSSRFPPRAAPAGVLHTSTFCDGGQP